MFVIWQPQIPIRFFALVAGRVVNQSPSTHDGLEEARPHSVAGHMT
jgi:hypothetical protein